MYELMLVQESIGRNWLGRDWEVESVVWGMQCSKVGTKGGATALGLADFPESVDTHSRYS